MKFNIDDKWRAQTWSGLVCVFALVILLNLGKIASGFAVFSTVILGAVIAYILNLLAVWINKTLFRKMKKQKAGWIISVILSLIIVLAFIGTLLTLLIPQIISGASSIVNNIDVYTEMIQNLAKKLHLSDATIQTLTDYLAGDNGLFTQLGMLIVDNLQAIIDATSSAGSKLMNLFIGLIMAIYFLCAKDDIKKAFARLFELILSPARYTQMNILMEKFNAIFSKYIACEILDSLIVGEANFIFMTIMGMPIAVLVSVTVALANLAPTFGPVVGAIIGGFMLLITSPKAVIPFLIFTFILQTIDGYILKPKLFGGVLNVPGVLILVAIIVFGKLMGVTGMLISIPVAAILFYLVREVLIPYLELKRDLKHYNKDNPAE